MKKLFAPLLLSLAVLLLAGCGSSTAVITSGLQVDLVKLQRAGNGDIQVTWRVRNPNVVPYVLARTNLKISLAGKPIGTLTDPTRIGVPSGNEVQRTGVLTLGGPEAGQTISQAIAQGTAPYSLNASLWMVLTEDKEEKFQLTGSGTVPVTAE